jgi:hypothetical protein
MAHGKKLVFLKHILVVGGALFEQHMNYCSHLVTAD